MYLVFNYIFLFVILNIISLVRWIILNIFLLLGELYYGLFIDCILNLK